MNTFKLVNTFLANRIAIQLKTLSRFQGPMCAERRAAVETNRVRVSTGLLTKAVSKQTVEADPMRWK